MKPSCYREMFSFIWVSVICRVGITLFCLGNQSTASFDVYCTSMLIRVMWMYVHWGHTLQGLRAATSMPCSEATLFLEQLSGLWQRRWNTGFSYAPELYLLAFMLLFTRWERFCSVRREKDKIIEGLSQFKSLHNEIVLTNEKTALSIISIFLRAILFPGLVFLDFVYN